MNKTTYKEKLAYAKGVRDGFLSSPNNKEYFESCHEATKQIVIKIVKKVKNDEVKGTMFFRGAERMKKKIIEELSKI